MPRFYGDYRSARFFQFRPEVRLCVEKHIPNKYILFTAPYPCDLRQLH